MNAWLSAFRLRTLPLALSCIGMGTALAAAAGKFQWSIALLCGLTTVFLQVLSNLANDYGDTVNGADHAGRSGPQRAVQSGSITPSAMRMAIVIFSLLSLGSGLALLRISLGDDWQVFLAFLGLGLVSILAAITYTMGRRPYGYAGLGDLSVLIFFGLVGVLGSTYLFTQSLQWLDMLPAYSCGVFAVGVLNINNVRDMASDRAAGKFSIPVRIGKEWAARYHWFLLISGLLAATVFVLADYRSPYQFLFLLSAPFFGRIGMAVTSKPSEALDPYLKQMALSTLLFVLLFGLGQNA